MKYGGFDFSNYLICKPQTPLLPGIDLAERAVPGRDGAVLSGVALKPRDITVSCTILPEVNGTFAEKKRSVAALRHRMAALLFAREPQPLVLDDDPLRFYWAVVADAPDPAAIGAAESFDIVFRCHDPIAYGQEHCEWIEGEATVRICGSYRTYPVFDVVAGAATGALGVEQVETGEFVRVDRSFAAGAHVRINMACKTAFIGEVAVPVALSSDFFALEPGVRRLRILGGAAEMTYREAWL